jgi:ubiquinone/menaquinone biosynthesis C-methylase UbiE
MDPKAPLTLLLEQTDAVEHDHFWFRGFRRFTDPLLDHAAAGRTNLTLLDCGCGTGLNMQRYQRYGTVFGFDITRLGLELAHQRKEQHVAQGSTTHIPFASGRFDILTSFDVLVCLDEEQEAEAFGEFFRVLKPGGHVLINVAALEILRGAHSAVAMEVRRYRRRMLRTGLERAGFRIERLTYTNAALFPIMLAVRLAQRLGGLPSAEEAGNNLAIPAAPLNAAFSAALAFESRLLRLVDMPLGSSVLCLARKP